MASRFTWKELDGTERLLDVDATLREGQTLTAEVTEHPVERGAPVSDHVRDKPDSVTFEFLITNTPVSVPLSHADGVSGGFRSADGSMVLQFDAEFNRVKAVEQDLRRIKAAALLWHIETDLRDYEDFVIEQITPERSDSRGSSAKFAVTFRHFHFVTTSVVAVPRRIPRTRPPVSHGQQPPQPPRDSTLFSWLGSGH